MLGEVLAKLRKVAWFVPGFILWAAFPPMAERADVLFALAPLMWLSRKGDAKESVKRWTQSGMFFWVATLSWMPAIVKNNGPWPLVVLGWAALSAYCAAYFAVYGYLSAKYWGYAKTSRSEWLFRIVGVLAVEPLLWCGLELVRSRFLGGFAWNQLGVVSVNSGFGSPASIGGVYLCSAAVVLINGTFAGILERVIASVKRERVERWRTLETLATFALVWGIYQLPQLAHAPRNDAGSLKVALVQRNFPCCFKENEENPYETYERLLRNVKELKPDLVVLSESAMCDFGPLDRRGATAFAEWVAKETGAALLAGGSRSSDGKLYNSAALYATNSSYQVYDKVHLVPFGEFVPGDKWFPILQKFAPVGSCTPGEMKLLDLDGRRIGVAICFEDTDSALMRSAAAKGAEVLAFITNDSWFSQSDEAVAHSWQATARAIETGLPVVRVGNSGVTGTIAADGKTSWLVNEKDRPLVDKAGTMFDRVAFTEFPMAPTPYVTLGDWPLGIAFLLLISTMIMIKYQHERKER